jgi:hypothetical protein
MLYRNPEVPLPASLLSRTLRAIARFGANRRRRIAELDLLAMSGHLKRDLGLDAWTNPRR